MPKKGKKQGAPAKEVPRVSRKRSMGQRLSDELTEKAGSWGFIIMFLTFLIIWMAINLYLMHSYGKEGAFDPYPFILLNLVLSCLAAIQAPIILMSQNRAAEIDRQRAKRDYYVDRKAEKEIKILQRDLLELKAMLSKQPKAKGVEALEKEIKRIQQDLEAATSGVT